MDILERWQQALAPLARLRGESRLIRLLAAPAGQPSPALDALMHAAVLEGFSGREAVCEPFRFRVRLLAHDAGLDLAPLLGQPLGLELRCADGGTRRWFGLVTEAGSLGSDGGLARYALTLEPFTALLQLRRNALIFQDRDVQGIAEQVLADYPLATLRWEATQALPVRPITIQFRESDFDFLTRLLAEAGLAWHFEHGADDAPAGHAWVVRDREAPVPDGGRVRFHRIDATEDGDAVSRFASRRQAVPSARAVASWHSERLAVVSASSQADADALPEREVFSLPRDGRFADDAQAVADLQLDALRVAQTVHAGAGSERRLQPAMTHALSGHPRQAQPFVPLVIEHDARNNLGGGMVELLSALGLSIDGLERGSYRNRFLAVDAGTALVPRDAPRPRVHGPQTARVVGLPDDALTPTRGHQVRIQFPWQRGASPHPGGLSDTGSSATPDGHAPGDATSGSWVPVAEWLAGPNWGSHFLPRIGAEVLVEFLHGDIDQPRVTGQLYNGQVELPFAAGIDGAANHPGTLSGLHTQSHDQSGSQQWLLDDAPGQLRTRLHTSLAQTRLELGYLVEHDNGHRGGLRGLGFDLASQGWGNLHAGRGLLLSTTARANAASTQLDVAEAVAQLTGAERTAQALHETLLQQQVPGLEANPQQTALRQAIDPAEQGKYGGSVNGQSATKPAAGAREGGDPVEAFADPRLLAETPERMAWVTPASAVAFAGNTLHLTVQDDAHLAAAQTASAVSGRHGALYAHADLRAIAANGPLSVQAHTGPLELLADQSVTLTANDTRIDVLAKDRIVLQAGQTAITLQGSDITFACPGQFTVKASQHPFLGGESGDLKLSLPDGLVHIDPERMLDFSG
ncbi:type VI secretion system tip protein VgrG [Pseudoxanthomonas kalamensis DSM 18571]|uniref:type VI secretion system Vgr family protein n=1 Tax=Pseudoxanthomonas kalamensis TaxID=289483 RepID=UPI00139199FE|nr:type VI secretion system Vgr family protein [Pseudoxanthomonas kalamensis]KAF1712006.1 type VI secretion system tip protein VgrG [Pseudoxanthomonas kalamensis DSM 18571]